MFTREELLAQAPTLQGKPLHFLRMTEYHAGEAGTTRIFKGWVKDFESAVHFYCMTLVYWEAEGLDFSTWEEGWLGWVKPQIENDSLCRPISFQEFQEWMMESINNIMFFTNKEGMVTIDEVNQMMPSQDTADFVGALQMTQRWNDFGVLGQFKDEFVYIKWHTTA